MENKIKQEIKGDNNFQQNVDNQVINVGLSPEAATQLAIKLFYDNFPKLLNEAQKIVNERVKELTDDLFQKLSKKDASEYEEFKDPGMQFTLVESMKGYATYGDHSKLNLLTSLLVGRLESKDSFVLKSTIDNAIKIANSLSKDQLDYLALIFFVKHCHNNALDGKIDETVAYFNNFLNIFALDDFHHYFYLNSIGCLQLLLGTAVEKLSKKYKLDKNMLNEKLDKRYDNIPGDWGLSYTGIVIAITYINIKTNLNLDYNIWIN